MNPSINWLFVTAGVVGVFGLIVGILKYRSARPCRFKGHDKEYVGAQEQEIHSCCSGVDYHKSECTRRCPDDDCDYDCGEFKLQVFRWACRRCPKLGQYNHFKPKNKGYLKIENGKLVPDVKRWANFGEKP